ncbi:hypothetical protein D1872_312180 [compost metagenome]
MVTRNHRIIAHLVHYAWNALAIHQRCKGCTMHCITDIQQQCVRVLPAILVDDTRQLGIPHLGIVCYDMRVDIIRMQQCDVLAAFRHSGIGCSISHSHSCSSEEHSSRQ